jgi:hypothetical protein
MKKLLSSLLLIALMSTACTKDQLDLLKQQVGAEDNPNRNPSTIGVPAVVMTAFNTRYADATNTEWKKLSDGNFKAQFFRGAVKWEVIFSPTGVVVKEEHK